jgi:hypothetical protein
MSQSLYRALWRDPIRDCGSVQGQRCQHQASEPASIGPGSNRSEARHPLGTIQSARFAPAADLPDAPTLRRNPAPGAGFFSEQCSMRGAKKQFSYLTIVASTSAAATCGSVIGMPAATCATPTPLACSCAEPGARPVAPINACPQRKWLRRSVAIPIERRASIASGPRFIDASSRTAPATALPDGSFAIQAAIRAEAVGSPCVSNASAPSKRPSPGLHATRLYPRRLGERSTPST